MLVSQPDSWYLLTDREKHVFSSFSASQKSDVFSALIALIVILMLIVATSSDTISSYQRGQLGDLGFTEVEGYPGPGGEKTVVFESADGNYLARYVKGDLLNVSRVSGDIGATCSGSTLLASMELADAAVLNASNGEPVSEDCIIAYRE